MMTLLISLVLWTWNAIAETPAAPAATDENEATVPLAAQEESATDTYLKMRDPFKPPELSVAEERPKTELEKYPATDFQLLGVLTGPLKVSAILRDPEGKTYYVSENLRIGQRNGVIKRITTQSIIVREKIVNAIGREENVDTEIVLTKKP